MTPRQLAWVALAAAAAWLLHPLLTPAHVEGFSASIVSIGLHIAHGNVAAYDLVHPVNLEFFALSRLGTSLAVTAFASFPGVSGDGAMRATMWLGLVLLIGGTWVLARRWTRADPLVIAAAMLLVPGVFENSFFYNDNVLSAGLAVASLAIVEVDGCIGPTLLAGVMFGLAMLARTDAVLLAPAFALVMFARDGLGRRTWLLGAAFGVAAFVPYAGILAAFGATPFDVLHISRYAVVLWDRGPQLYKHRREIIIFIGIPGIVLGALGIAELVQRRRWQALALLAGVPLLFNLVYLGKFYQSRQALPLAPCLVALVIVGWQWITAAERAPTTRRVAMAVVALVIAVTWAGPVTGFVTDDGPRVGTGRLATIVRWSRWQHAVDRNIADIRHFADVSGTPRVGAILTDDWDADRYLHLALLDAGYTVVPAGTMGPACARTAELFQRGAQRVLHIRTAEPFLPADRALRPERIDRDVMPCLDASRPATLRYLAPTWEYQQLFGALVTTDWMDREARTYHDTGYPPKIGVELDPASLGHLRMAYAVVAADARGDAKRDGKPLFDLAAADRMMAPQVSFPR